MMERLDETRESDVIELGSVTDETKGPGGPTGDSAGQLNLGGLSND
jgi:hypothetical protein